MAEGRFKKQYIKILDNLSNLLINLTKARTEKEWLLYEFPFRLNLCDIPNDTQTWKSDSLLYPGLTENQFQAKKKRMGALRAAE